MTLSQLCIYHPLTLSISRLDSTTNSPPVMSSINESGTTDRGLPSVVLIVDVSLLVSTLVLGLFFNGALITSVRRNRRLWTLTNGLLTCEAIANLSILSVGVPVHLAAVLLHPSALPRIACVVHAALHFGGHVLVSGIVTTVAYHRYLTICSGNSCLLRRRRLLLWVSPACACALLATFIKFFLTPPNIFCLQRDLSSTPSAIAEWLNLAPFVVFVLIVFYSYAHITYSFLDARPNRLSAPISTVTIPPPRIRHKVPRHRLRVNIVTTLSCLLHALMAIFNYAPAKLFTLFAFYSIHDDEKWTIAFSLILSVDHALLALVDPFLYLVVSKEVRQEVVAILLCTRKDRKKINSDQFTNVISRVKFTVRTVQRNDAFF